MEGISFAFVLEKQTCDCIGMQTCDPQGTPGIKVLFTTINT